MHVEILDVLVVGLLVVVRAEPGQAFVAEVRFHRIYSSNQNVHSTVELLLVQDQRVVYVPLRQELVVEGRLRQVSKLLQQDDSFATTAFGRLGYERLVGVLAHVVFEVPHLVWQQERVGHELVINWEKPLEPAYDDAEYVFLRKVIHQGVPIELAFAHLDDVQIVVSEGHTVPQNRPISGLIGLSVPVLANHILQSVELCPAVIGVDYNLGPPQLVLLFSVHNVVLVLLLTVLLVQVVNALALRVHYHEVTVRVLRLLRVL